MPELGHRAGDFAVGTITRLHESKGNCYLVDAAATGARSSGRRRGSSSSAKGRSGRRSRRRRSALGLGDRFVFAGFVADVPRVLSAFDLSVFPSLWEGTPLTVFEALAMGKPIVATDADGLLDVLTAGPRRAHRAQRNARQRSPTSIVWAIDHPDERARLAARRARDGPAATASTRSCEDGAALQLLHQVSRARGAAAILQRRPLVPRRAESRPDAIGDAGGRVRPREPSPRPASRRTATPASAARGAFVLGLFGGFALSVDFPRAAYRLPERRSHATT